MLEWKSENLWFLLIIDAISILPIFFLTLHSFIAIDCTFYFTLSSKIHQIKLDNIFQHLSTFLTVIIPIVPIPTKFHTWLARNTIKKSIGTYFHHFHSLHILFEFNFYLNINIIYRVQKIVLNIRNIRLFSSLIVREQINRHHEVFHTIHLNIWDTFNRLQHA